MPATGERVLQMCTAFVCLICVGAFKTTGKSWIQPVALALLYCYNKPPGQAAVALGQAGHTVLPPI